jgi:RNA polymerase sigma factor (sigma-70 family)
MEAWREKLAAGDSDAAWNLFIERYRNLIFAVIRRTLKDEDDIADVFSDVCADLSDNNLSRIAKQPEAGKARFSTWLVTVVHHRAIDWVRHREGRRRIVIPDGLSPLQQEIFTRVVAEHRSHAEAYELIRQRSNASLAFGDFLKEVAATYKVLDASGKAVGRYFPGPPLEIVKAEPDPHSALLLNESSEQLSRAMQVLSPDERLAVQLFVVDELAAASVATIVGWPNAKSVYNRVSRALDRLRRELELLGVKQE